MIRADKAIKGIPIPGPDGELATHATRLASGAGDTLTDRGLVDDTMVALASRESILPLLRVLDRFEAMSNHRMNISKTMMLLLGRERGFDLSADEPAARALRRRGLERTYDISPGRDDRLPDKWHGIVLGNEAGTSQAWRDTVAQAGEMAESLHACTMPHGSRGRVALANGKLMGKAYAAMRLTAPASQQAVDSCLQDLQRWREARGPPGLWQVVAHRGCCRAAAARFRGRAPARAKVHASSLGTAPPRSHGQGPREAPFQALLRPVRPRGIPGPGYGQGAPLPKPRLRHATGPAA